MSDSAVVEFNPDGFDELHRTVAVRLSEVDAEVRAKCLGLSVKDIAVAAQGAFETIGVEFTDEQVAEYADAVSREAPFELKLV